MNLGRKLDDGTKTRGLLTLPDGSEPMLTLELPWKENAKNVSCVPAGTYRCAITSSTRFKHFVLRLFDVPGREGILIHSGNTTRDTEGCILPGLIETPDGVGRSTVAFARVIAWAAAAAKMGDVWITIRNVPPPRAGI